MKGYKAFDKNLNCRGYQYEIGKTYTFNGDPILCKQGFHFCKSIAECYRYYPKNANTRICEIEAIGDTVTDDEVKYCTNKITIVREIDTEWERRGNTNGSSSGYCNTGNRNTGNWNTGDWNTGNYNTGVFCTERHKILIFDKESDMNYEDWRSTRACYLLNSIPKTIIDWIYEEDMTDEEKEANPSYETTRGYLKVLDESSSAQIWWDGLTDDDKQEIYNIPNFDAEKFEKCTGIRVGE